MIPTRKPLPGLVIPVQEPTDIDPDIAEARKRSRELALARKNMLEQKTYWNATVFNQRKADLETAVAKTRAKLNLAWASRS